MSSVANVCVMWVLASGAVACGQQANDSPSLGSSSSGVDSADDAAGSELGDAASGTTTSATDAPGETEVEPDDDGTDGPPVEGPLAVVQVSPGAQRVDAPRDAEIVVVFEGAVDPASVDLDSVSVWGRWSGVASGTLSVDDDGSRVRFSPSAPLMPGEQITVTLSTGLRSVGGEALAQGYAWSYWTAAEPGTLDLELTGQRSARLPGEGWIQTYGAYAGDLNGDGASDLMLPNEQADDVRIFLNDGQGGYPDFAVTPIPGGSVPSTNEGADFDRDGLMDFAVGSAGGSNVSVFRGMGDGTVMHTGNVAVGQSVRGLCVLDLDGDGDADLVSASRTGQGDGDIATLFNDGGTFSVGETINPGGLGESACAVGDANGDGLTDVFIGALQSNEVFLYVADGNGGLTLSDQVEAGGGPWMLAAGDLDGDGFVDVVAADFPGNAMSVIRSDGDGHLMPAVVYPTGSSPLAIDVGDIDGDGDLDALSSNFEGGDFTLYENDGDGTLANPRTLLASEAGSCAIVHDRDNDGDMDVTAIDELDDVIFFFTNPG